HHVVVLLRQVTALRKRRAARQRDVRVLRRPERAEPALFQRAAELGRAHRVVREEDRRAEVHVSSYFHGGPDMAPIPPHVRHAPASTVCTRVSTATCAASPPLASASVSTRPSRPSRSAIPSRARMVGVTSTLPAGASITVRVLKSTPHARNVLRTFHGLMLPWSLASGSPPRLTLARSLPGTPNAFGVELHANVTT